LKCAEAVLAPRKADLLETTALDAIEILWNGWVQVARIRLPLKLRSSDVATRGTERVGRVRDRVVQSRGVGRDTVNRADNYIGADRGSSAITSAWDCSRHWLDEELAEEDGRATQKGAWHCDWKNAAESQTGFHL
jgi:hypothetical protein